MKDQAWVTFVILFPPQLRLSHTRWLNVFFEPDSAQPNQCISGPYRNKKKFSSDCEVYEGVKKGAERGNLSIGLWSSEVAPKIAKIP